MSDSQLRNLTEQFIQALQDQLGDDGEATLRQAHDEEKNTLFRYLNAALERQIAERTTEVHASEVRFRTLFEYSPIGMALVAPDGRWLDTNRALSEMVGYSKSELLATTFQALTHPDDAATDVHNIQRLLRGEVFSYQREKRYLHKQGHTIWAIVHVSLVRDAQGTPVHLIAQIQDIAVRKQAEAVLREGEEQLRTLNASAPIGIFLTAANGDRTYTNAHWQSITGLTLEQSLGQGWLQAVHPDDRARVVQTWRACQDNKQEFVCEFRMMRLSGEVRWVQSRAIAQRGDNGMRTGYVGTTVDITERRRAETWVSRLIETTQDAVISIDRQGCIVLFNPAAEKIFGYTPQEVQGRHVRLLMPEPYASEHDSYVERYECTRTPRAIGRVRMVAARRKNGEVFPMELSVTEVGSDDEVRYAAFIRDVSERVRLQEQLLDRERLATIGTTVAKLAHEIGNPLNGMSVATQLLERRLGKLTEDEMIQSSVRALRNQTTRLANLLAEFRSLSRRQSFAFRPTKLTEVIQDVINTELGLYTERGVAVEQAFSADLPPVIVDQDKLKQVVLNLCKNAIEAMPDGGTLTLRVHHAGESVQIEVADTGTGIPDGVNIFEPFMTTKREGTGLGLSIARQIIAAHDGTLTYRSELGKGTTFVVALPLQFQGEARRA